MVKLKAGAASSASKPLSLSGSDDVEVVSPVRVEKRILPLRQRRTAQAQRDESSSKELLGPQIQDISSASGSDFQPDDNASEQTNKTFEDEKEVLSDENNADSDREEASRTRKRKAKVEVSSRPTKKRVIVEMPPAPYLTSKAKGKRKEVNKLRRTPSQDSSEDEVSG